MIPNIRWSIASSQPPNMAQTTFAIGCLLKSSFTFFPYGKSDNLAILKHCMPKGIPITVIHKTMPHNPQNNANHIPPKINHKTFDINLSILQFPFVKVQFLGALHLERTFELFLKYPSFPLTNTRYIRFQLSLQNL